jgi:signal transduction histidine kinase
VREAVRAAGPLGAAGPSDGPALEVTVGDEVGDLVVQADKRRLVQVVANLVANAERHGGGLAAVGLERGGDRVRILIDDAGPGVPAAYRRQIFERFSRAPASAGARHDGGGVGLGLALVAEHVRLHGGAVWVEDRPGGGARFVVELPVRPP